MGVFTTVEEATYRVPAHRMFKALVTERQIMAPKVMPSFFNSMEIVHGDGGVGTVKKATFAQGLPFKTMSLRIDALDTENYYVRSTLFEGEMIGDTLEKIVHEIKMEPLETGCKSTVRSNYHLKPGAVFNEAVAEATKMHSQMLNKAMEEYLLSHPDVCV
uniref:Pathogenesis related class 10 protein n=1 Tax=Hypericum tomentosum TaxID=1137039 RepID=A0A2R4SDQ6_9ROSI|nr:pathogenesis related class 10 protein [Hypericum tomentosum]